MKYVKCLNDSNDVSLTKGKIYGVISESDELVEIENDASRRAWYLVERFEPATPQVSAKASDATEGNQAQKKDAGKPRMSLLPFDGLTLVVRVLEFGIFKYGQKSGWRKVDNAVERYTDALQRHAGDLCDHGIDHIDPDSGLPTIAHLACDAIFLCAFRFTGHGDPGRPWLCKKT